MPLSKQGMAAALCALFLAATGAQADAPEWLRVAAREPVSAYAPDTPAVVLLDERTTSLNDSGEIKTVYRRAIRILRREGSHRGAVAVHFDSDTRLTFLKAWCLPLSGAEYEVKENEAIETTLVSETLYDDTRFKSITIPASDPGSVVGYEYEQKGRPWMLQDFWPFQQDIPVRRARYVLQMPDGWEYSATWLNHPEQPARTPQRNRWSWEMENVPAVEPEPAMPALGAVSARVIFRFIPSATSRALGIGTAAAHAMRSWQEFGRWYSELADPQRQATPELRQQVAELTASAADAGSRMAALAAFAQRRIRYVAIQIGIGGYRPHAARDVFVNRYGDCKDKVTLLSAMLRESGIESYYTLVHTSRGVVRRESPPSLTFNHVILAIRLPRDSPPFSAASATIEHPNLGRILFFDPTDEDTPLGYLPSSLQAGYGLLVGPDGGELLLLPLATSQVNRQQRLAKLVMQPDGTVTGDVTELYYGTPAFGRRASMLSVPVRDWAKKLEDAIGPSLIGYSLTKASIGNLRELDAPLVMSYSLRVANYGKSAGPLLLVRPRLLDTQADLVPPDRSGKPRKLPVELGFSWLFLDTVEITLPPGYVSEELPPPLDLDCGAATYKSKVELAGSLLKYRRELRINAVRVDPDQLAALRDFLRKVDRDERSSAIFRRAPAPPPL